MVAGPARHNKSDGRVDERTVVVLCGNWHHTLIDGIENGNDSVRLIVSIYFVTMNRQTFRCPQVL